MNIRKMPSLKRIPKKPIIYIAAPFTSFATINSTLKSFFSSEFYGIIEENYKNILLELESFFKKLGLDPFLPHKEINQWGNVELSSSEILKPMLNSIEKSDIIFAVPSNSIGVHLELGMGLALQKRIIVVEVEELKSSFFLSGLRNHYDVLSLKSKNLESLIDDLRNSHEILNFIKTSLKQFGL